MTLKSIRYHLKPYSIIAKRRTTVAHAFASALAPCDRYDQALIEKSLLALGQDDLNHLECVYCRRPAQTWDHLENLVKAGRLNGYGHQIGNLVPSCRECNSEKGGKTFRAYVSANLLLSEAEKKGLIQRLENHIALAKPIKSSASSQEHEEILNRFLSLQAKVIELMEEADRCAAQLRSRTDG